MPNNKFLEETGLSRLWSHVKKLVDTRATKIETRVTSLESQVNADKLTAYPVGAIYMSVSPTSPASLFGGTWTQWGSGRVPIGVDANDSDFNTVEKTNGTKINRIGFITAGNGYGLAQGGGYGGKTLLSEYQGDGGYIHKEFSILQPYITCYMWKRVS